MFAAAGEAAAQGAPDHVQSVERAEVQSARCDGVDKATLDAGPLCVDAANAWLAAAEVGEREAAAQQDSAKRNAMLANVAADRNNAAAYLLMARDCARALEVLRPLAETAVVKQNPALLDRVARKLVVAQRCMDARTLPVSEVAPAMASEAPSETPAAAVQVVVPEGPVADDPSRLNWAPLAVAGVGVATFLGAVGWDLALADDRALVGDRLASCSGVAGQDCVSYNQARTRIVNAQLPIGLLYGLGTVAAIGGTVWWWKAAPPHASADVSLGVGPEAIDVVANIRW